MNQDRMRPATGRQGGSVSWETLVRVEEQLTLRRVMRRKKILLFRDLVEPGKKKPGS